MERISHTDLVLLAGAVLAAFALLLLSLGVTDGGSRIATAEAATLPAPAAAPSPARSETELAAAARPAKPEPATDTTILTVKPGATVDLRTSPGGKVFDTVGERTEFDSPTVLTVLERRGGWAGVPTELRPNGELAWVRIGDPGLATDTVGQSIVIDLSEMRGELSRNGEVERRWTVGIGGSGTPTPTGRFSITDELDSGLNPVYGCCAIALSATQPNLPAGWTGGDRIAIHGTSEPLGEANSTGCVHSSDADLHALIEGVPLGTPVTIRR
ncbi:MAG: L,D-transpeptidase [Solirubrobacterales bacterium]